MLETREHPYSYFVTLTYHDDHLPEDGQVDKQHAKDFIKALRQRVEPARIRHFLVGEYGDDKRRPHYHALIWADEEVLRPETLPHVSGPTTTSRHIRAAWHNWGRTECLPLLTHRDAMNVSRYVASYVVKKWTTEKRIQEANDGEMLEPEFTLMSNRPGIGCLPATIDRITGNIQETDDRDFQMLRLHGKLWPVGRTLLEKLRSRTNPTLPPTPAQVDRERYIQVVGQEEYLNEQREKEGRAKRLKEASRREAAKRKSSGIDRNQPAKP